MTIKELFDKAENETLDYETFEKLMKEGSAKFVDLSEGNYVSKDKYENELAGKDTQINTLNDTIKTRDGDLKDLKAKLKDAGTDAEKLTDLETKLENLQTQYKEDTKKYQQQLEEQARDFAVNSFADTLEFSSNAAKRDFIRYLSSQEFKLDGKKIIGDTDYASKYFEENKDAKKVKQAEPQPAPPESTPLPSFSAPASGKDKPQTPSLSELMKMKNDNPGTIINFGN